MLYEMHEFRRAALAPFVMWAQASASLFSSPYSALTYTPMSRNMAAGYDLLVRLGKRYEKPEFGFTETLVDGAPVAVSEEIAFGKPFCNLLHFKRDTKRKDPVVFVAVASLLVLIGLYSCWIPARRAAALHPVQALREE